MAEDVRHETLGRQGGLAVVAARETYPPDADLAGMDIVVQARSGLMAAMGRLIDGRPAPGEPVISDYMAAMSLAFGIASALFRRQRTGKGGIVDVSLMQAAMTLANNQLVRQEDMDREKHFLCFNRELRPHRKLLLTMLLKENLLDYD